MLAEMLLVKSKKTDTMAETVLVVDDDSSIREVLHKFFTLKGYEVVLAANGEPALELAKCEIPKAILLDINMPGIDGVETCRRLRAEEQTRYIPVIMVTAFGTTQTEATDAGADDLINKPFNLTDLAVRVKSLLRIGHLSDPVQRLMTYMDELDANRPD